MAVTCFTHRVAPAARQGLLAAGFWLLSAASGAQTVGLPDWQVSVAPFNTTQHMGRAVALDAGNNAYLAATASGRIVLNRYTPAGLLQWSRALLTGASLSQGLVVVDAAGSAVVVGQALAKYGADGTLIWSQTWPGAAAGASASAAVTDAGGDVYVVGNDASGAKVVARLSGLTGQTVWSSAMAPGGYNPVIKLAGAQVVTSAGNDLQLQLATFSAASGAPVATRTLPMPGTYSDLAIGPSGEVVVAGGGSLLLPGWAYQVSMFDSSLATLLYAKTLAAGTSARRVAIDAQRNVYLTGLAVDPGSTPYTYPNGVTVSGPWSDWLTMKLDPAGNLLWSARLSRRSDLNEDASQLQLAPDGAVWVAGSAGLAGAATPTRQATTVMYGADGSLLWTADSAAAVAVGDLRLGTDGGLYAVGTSPQGQLWHFPGPARPVSMAFSSSSVTGGKTLTATVQVSTSAGAVIKLSSSRPGVASVPASVSVPAGATRVSFTVTTYRVKGNTAVTLTATANGASTSGVITVRR